MKRNKYLLVVLFYMISCNNSPRIGEDLVVHIDLKNAKLDIKDTAQIKETSYVFLETKKECLIGSCNKILTVNNYIYVLDMEKTQSIYVFDKYGKFIFKIDKRGKGPGEYIQILDFCVDNQENIYIWDNGKRNIIKYSERGKKFKEFKIKSRFLEFCLITKDEVVVRDLFENGLLKASLAKINFLTQKKEIILNARNIYDDINIVRNSYYNLFISGNSVLFNPMFSNEILEIKNGKINKKISFNEDYFPKEEFVRQLKADPMLKYRNDRYISSIINIYQNSDVYAMTLIKGMPQMLFIDKKTCKYKIIGAFSKKDNFSTNFMYGVSGDYFISQLSTRLIQEKDWTNRIKAANLPQNTKEKLLRLDENANPVLIFLKIKGVS